MKFHVGPIPDNREFRPEEGGWKPLKEPTPWVLQLLVVPVALGVCVGALLTWRALIPSNEFASTLTASILLSLPALVALIPVHEYIHSKFHPFNGRSPATRFGFWPSRILIYAHYDDEMTRNRFLLVLVAPFAILTVAPVAMCALASVSPAFVVALSTMNGVASSADLFGLALIGLQVPASAILRNKGYRTWWRDAA